MARGEKLLAVVVLYYGYRVLKQVESVVKVAKAPPSPPMKFWFNKITDKYTQPKESDVYTSGGNH